MMEYAKLYWGRPARKRAKERGLKIPKWLKNKKRRSNKQGGTLMERAADMRSNPTRHEQLFMMALPKKLQAAYSFQHILAPYIVDFYFYKYNLAVEIDGLSHYQNKPYDERRDKLISDRHGVKVVRFSNYDVEGNPKHVMNRLQSILGHQAGKVSQSRFPRVVSAPSPKGGLPENRSESREHAAPETKVLQPLD